MSDTTLIIIAIGCLLGMGYSLFEKEWTIFNVSLILLFCSVAALAFRML